MSISSKCLFISIAQVVLISLLHLAVKYLIPDFYQERYFVFITILFALLMILYSYRIWLRDNSPLSLLRVTIAPLGYFLVFIILLLIDGWSVFNENYVGARVIHFLSLTYFILFPANEVAFVRRKFSSDILSVIPAERASIFAIIISVLLQLPVLFI